MNIEQLILKLKEHPSDSIVLINGQEVTLERILVTSKESYDRIKTNYTGGYLETES